MRHHSRPRVQFILKRHHQYGKCSSSHSSGLWNSAYFVSDMLREAGYETEVIQVTDNNDIDREVTRFNSAIVVIEAIWVVPSKFNVLKRLHPAVTWVVRGHSEFPFLASEGMAIEWICQYARIDGVFVAFNSTESFLETSVAVTASGSSQSKVLFLPNYYPVSESPLKKPDHGPTVRIGCFGAIRPLKNQLLQATAAIQFARDSGKRLQFFINVSRVESHGDPVLKNIRALFAQTGNELVEIPYWMEHDEFVAFIGQMDYSMCASLSETFCVVAADSVAAGIPLVASPAVSWASVGSQAKATSIESLTATLRHVTGNQRVHRENVERLQRYGRESRELWLDWLKGF